MTKIKEAVEVGEYIKEKINKLGLTQSDLANKMSDLMSGYTKDQLKDNISKWINQNRYPGTQFIYFLAQALEVSMEEIMVAGEVTNKYEDRPVTLYSAGKSKDIILIDKLMKNEEMMINYDEYDKTLLDYLIEFKNIEVIRYLVGEGYIEFDINYHSMTTQFRIYPGRMDHLKELIMLFIENDDVILFKKAFSRMSGILINENGKLHNNLVFKPDEVDKLVESSEIFNYLSESFYKDEKENNYYNHGVTYKNIPEMPTLSGSFNQLLMTSINNNKLDKVKKLLTSGIRHNNEVLELFKKHNLDPSHFYIRKNKFLKAGKYSYDCLSIMAGLDENHLNKLKDNKELYNLGLQINNSISNFVPLDDE